MVSARECNISAVVGLVEITLRTGQSTCPSGSSGPSEDDRRQTNRRLLAHFSEPLEDAKPTTSSTSTECKKALIRFNTAGAVCVVGRVCHHASTFSHRDARGMVDIDGTRYLHLLLYAPDVEEAGRRATKLASSETCCGIRG